MNATAEHMTGTIAPPAAAPRLPREKSQAINTMIRITQNLLALAEREAQALAMSDMLAFAILQDEKTLVVEQYTALSGEFRTNIEFYRGADKVLLDRLESLQGALAEKTRGNNACVEGLYGRTRGQIHSALVTAQELGQQRSVSFGQQTQTESE